MMDVPILTFVKRFTEHINCELLPVMVIYMICKMLDGVAGWSMTPANQTRCERPIKLSEVQSNDAFGLRKQRWKW